MDYDEVTVVCKSILRSLPELLLVLIVGLGHSSTDSGKANISFL